MKIPVNRRKDGDPSHPVLDVNARGLTTVAAMLFLFVAVLPKIVKLFFPQAQATATDNFIPLMGRVEEALQKMDVSPSECYQRSTCLLAKKSYYFNHTIPYSQSLQWLGSVTDNVAIQEAFHKGLKGDDCSEYNCPLFMKNVAQMLKSMM